MRFWPQFSPTATPPRRKRSLRFESLEARMMLAANLLAGIDDLSGQQLECDHGGGTCAEPSIQSGGNWNDGYLGASGNRYFEESLFEGEEIAGEAAASAPLAAPVSLGDTFQLHSNPGANHTIYLDFDGHVTSGTFWNSDFNGGQDIVTPAYSFQGDSSSFTNNELERIQRIWRWVSEDFLPFDVDVTTEDPGVAALSKTSGSDSNWGVRIVIGPNTFYGSAGGVAYLNSFNWSTDTPAFVFNNSELGVAEAASHEAGHTLGLLHDGQEPGDGPYYYGQGSGTTGWAPIMGVGYYQNLTQWSRGEYSNANNTEDDLHKITSLNGFGYRNDDHGGSHAAATPLISNGGAFSGAGIIERNSDYDVFSFVTSGGALSIDVDPFDYHPNLDILAQLYSSSGSLIASSNPIGALDARITATVGAGTYYLWVSGVGEGDPLATGYSDYGSLGYYSISGTGAGGDDTLAPGASLDAADITTPIGSTYTFAVTYNDNVAVDVSDLDNNDLFVTGPGGYSTGATFVSVDVASDGTPRTATYQVSGPGGTWDGADNGTYTIAVRANQVSDTNGNFVAAGSLGSFTVNVPVPDRFEVNDSFAGATDLGSSDRAEAGLNIHSTGDVDYFKWVAASDGTLDIDVLFQHAAGDIDIYLYGPDQVVVERSISVTDNESVSVSVTAGETFYLYIEGYNGATNSNYDLVINGPDADSVAPTASLGIGDITNSGGATHTFTVTYLDNIAVDVSDIGTGDVTVIGPDNFQATATFLSVDNSNDGTPRTATYQIGAPGGTWNVSHNGTYTVLLAGNQVRDTSGNLAAGQVLGTFSVNIQQAGLVGYWNLDDGSGTTASDTAGGDDNGTLKRGVAWTAAGQTGAALQFDGVNDYVSAVIDVSETEYSVSLWFRTDSADGGLFSVTDGELGARGSDRHVYLTGGNLASRIWNNETIQTSGLNLADGQWHHVVHTYGGSQGGQKLFVDGVMQASGAKSQSDFASQDRIQIGFSSNASSRFFSGTIDEVRVYDRALSNNEVLLLADQEKLIGYWNLNDGSGSTAADAAGGDNNGTLKRGVAWTGAGHTGGALHFDGVNDYVSAVIDVSETEYSVSLWFKTDSADGGLFSVTDGELGARGSDRHVYLTGGNLASRIWNNETIQTSGLNLADGQWHHLVHTYGGSQGGQKLFVDGVMQAGGAKSQSDFTSQDRIQIGFSSNAPSRFFSGTIDEVRVYDRALSDNEIANLAGANESSLPFASGPSATLAHHPEPAHSQAFAQTVDLWQAFWEESVLDHQPLSPLDGRLPIGDPSLSRLDNFGFNPVTLDAKPNGREPLSDDHVSAIFRDLGRHVGRDSRSIAGADHQWLGVNDDVLPQAEIDAFFELLGKAAVPSA